MPIKAVVYISEAAFSVAADSAGFKWRKLDGLVEDAARFNRDAGVTGVLLYDGAMFLQYLEGPEDRLAVVYSRVLGAGSHSGIVELQRATIGQRRLPFWPMRWLLVNNRELRQIAQADWTAFHRHGVATQITAMDRLIDLVQASHRAD
ncbi:BLUF domain-containing protein [Stenotrophomonas maltophilia]|uniref:BLUF domain-containing protein n=1 Tax=Stenotrophomonas maltophilia TaxID=40324 RepID=UPI002A9F3949|nr:BLUF domain-containing protein [Stenotrophomonas maltophilia]